MKKLFVLIFIFIIFVENCAIISYADCPIPPTIDELDLSKIISKKTCWDIQKIKDKNVDVVSYEDIYKVSPKLLDRLKGIARDEVRAQNSKYSWDTIKYFADFLASLVQSVKVDNTKRYEEAEESFGKSIPRKEMDAPISEGKETSAIVSSVNVLVPTGLLAAAQYLKKAGLVKVAKIAQAITSPTGTIIIIGLGIAAAVGYNIMLSNRLNKLGKRYDMYTNLYQEVKSEIEEHNWIGENFLILSHPTDWHCDDAYAKFLKDPRIVYEDLQKIDNNFALAKCQFLNDASLECREEVLKEIECLHKDNNNKSCLNKHLKQQIVDMPLPPSSDYFLTSEKSEL